MVDHTVMAAHGHAMVDGKCVPVSGAQAPSTLAAVATEFGITSDNLLEQAKQALERALPPEFGPAIDATFRKDFDAAKAAVKVAVLQLAKKEII